MQFDSTTWRDIPDHPSYRASADGQIWSKKYRRVLKTDVTWNGYARVNVGQKHYPVHQLVCAAFHGPKPSPDHVPNHKNGVKLDNRAENLEWATDAENRAHAVKTGLMKNRAQGIGPGKLSWALVHYIREQSQHRSNRSLATELRISDSMIGLVVRGICWKEPSP